MSVTIETEDNTSTFYANNVCCFAAEGYYDVVDVTCGKDFNTSPFPQPHVLVRLLRYDNEGFPQEPETPVHEWIVYPHRSLRETLQILGEPLCNSGTVEISCEKTPDILAEEFIIPNRNQPLLE